MTEDHDSRQGAPSGGPRGPISDSLAKPLPKRFYKAVSVAGGPPFQVLLDGRGIKTPRKRPLTVPAHKLADAIAAEWSAQVDSIDPARMPLTRFANSALDAVNDNLEEVAADVVRYAGRDLICYRAAAPGDLVAAQKARWDPILDWAARTIPAEFRLATGVMPVEQPARSLTNVAEQLKPHDAFRLSALHVLTTLTGSALIALGHAASFLTADDAWAAAHVDEDHQISLWGEDYEAAVRRKLRRDEFNAASTLLSCLAP